MDQMSPHNAEIATMSKKSETFLNRPFQLSIVIVIILTLRLLVLAETITVRSDVPGNVFVTGEQLSFDVRLDKAAPLALVVQDHMGTNVWEDNRPMTSLAVSVKVPVLNPGYYELLVSTRQEPVFEHKVSFAVLKPDTRKDDTNSKFAVWLHSWYRKDHPSYESGERWTRVCRLMRRAGIRWGIDAPWGVEGLKTYRADGLHLLAYFDPAYWPLKSNADAQANAAVLAERIREYSPLIRRWTIGPDEPENHKPDLELAMQMLKYCYLEAKAADPDVEIVWWQQTAIAARSFVAEGYKQGIHHFFDAMQVHPYCYPRAPENPNSSWSYQRLYELGWTMDAFGDGRKPVDVGCSYTTTHGNERQQAQHLVRDAVLSLAWGARQFKWYDLMDDGPNPDDPEMRHGIIRNGATTYGTIHETLENHDLTPKPAYVAYAVLTDKLDGATYAGNLSLGEVMMSNGPATPPGSGGLPFWPVYGVVFRKTDGSPLVVLWSVAKEATLSWDSYERTFWMNSNHPMFAKEEVPVTLKVNVPEVTVTEMMGAERIVKTNEDGTVTLQLTNSPIYLEGASPELLMNVQDYRMLLYKHTPDRWLRERTSRP